MEDEKQHDIDDTNNENTIENVEKKTSQTNVPKKDGGYGWIVLFASFVCNTQLLILKLTSQASEFFFLFKFVNFIMDGVMYSFGIILDEIKRTTQEKQEICNLLSGLNTGFLFSSGKMHILIALLIIA